MIRTNTVRQYDIECEKCGIYDSLRTDDIICNKKEAIKWLLCILMVPNVRIELTTSALPWHYYIQNQTNRSV